MNQRRKEIEAAYYQILTSRMNQRRQEILRTYHQAEEAAIYENFRLAEEEEGRRIYDEWMAQWE